MPPYSALMTSTRTFTSGLLDEVGDVLLPAGAEPGHVRRDHLLDDATQRRARPPAEDRGRARGVGGDAAEVVGAGLAGRDQRRAGRSGSGGRPVDDLAQGV